MKENSKKKVKELKKLLQKNRIDILSILYVQHTCVCQMVNRLNLKHNLISHHLKTLQDMGYIQSKRNGKHIIYSMSKDKKETVTQLFNILNK